MKTVRELAQEIGVSRQSVYRKIKELGLLQELQQSDSKVKPKLQLNKQQEKTLKRAFNINFDSNKVTEELQQSDSKVTEELQQSDSSVTRLIDTLQANNEEKQKTIESLQEIIKNLQETTKEQTKLLDQQQQLTLKTQQQLELLQLEYKDTPLKAETKQEENTTVKQSKWKFWKRGN